MEHLPLEILWFFLCRVVLKIVSSGFRLQIVALLSKNVASLIDTSIGSGKIEYKKTDFNKIPFRISRSGKRDLLSVASLEQWLAVSYYIKINQLFILSIKSLTTPGSWHVFLIDAIEESRGLTTSTFHSSQKSSLIRLNLHTLSAYCHKELSLYLLLYPTFVQQTSTLSPVFH